MGIRSFVRAFREPGEEYSPCPFWFLNDELRPEELERQLRDFKQKGVHRVVAHPRIGIPREMPYLSDSFMDAVSSTVDSAASLHMQVVLYDEGMYPSGCAHGEVVRRNPAFASWALYLTREAQASGQQLHRFADGTRLLARPSGGTIRGIHFGEDDGEPDAPPSADILNPEATALFIRLTHDRYYERLHAHFGRTIIGFFTDEPCPQGRNAAGGLPWTPGFEQVLAAEGVPLASLRGLFEGQEDEHCLRYHRLIRDRLNSAYYVPLSAWCEAHGIALMGHPEQSDDIDEQRFFQIPGQDLIMRRVAPERGGIRGMETVQGKCSADAARHSGRRRNSNECFGVCGRTAWDFPGQDMKWMTDWLLLRGVNLLIPHAFYYSIRAPRHLERPPDVGPHSIWWPHYRQYADYVSRLSWLMTDSRNAAQIAVLCESRRMQSDSLARLFEQQVEFNYLPLSLLKEARLEDGVLQLQGYRYTHYLPLDGEQLPLVDISLDTDLPRDLATDRPCPMLRASHLIKQGQHVYLLVNEGEEEIRCGLRVPVEGRPFWYDAWRDRLSCARTDNEGAIPLRLLPFESLALILDREGALDAPEMPQPQMFDLNPLARLVAEDREAITKTYEAVLALEELPKAVELRVQADDMVACWCNGRFLGASFWNPHRFDAAAALKRGENTVRLQVTGSLGNRYGSPVPYGLRPHEAL